MQNKMDIAAEQIAMFCRLQMYVKKELPIRSSEMGVLIYIHKQDGDVTPLMISNFFQIAKPSVTAMISELIKKGYLIKVPSITDRRSYTVSITSEGQELVQSTRYEYYKTIEVLKEKMGQENFEAFLKLIQNANEILKEVRC